MLTGYNQVVECANDECNPYKDVRTHQSSMALHLMQCNGPNTLCVHINLCTLTIGRLVLGDAEIRPKVRRILSTRRSVSQHVNVFLEDRNIFYHIL